MVRSTSIRTNSTPVKIAIDFDGTCVSYAFPLVGKEIGASGVLLELVAAGHDLILFTMRSDQNADDPSKEYLTHALDWFHSHEIPLYGIQCDPGQKRWTSSPKAYANLYIDDAALGCSLKSDPELSDKPFVDLTIVRDLLVEQGIIPTANA